MGQARILNKSIAGRAIAITTAVTSIHELVSKWSRDTLEFTVFNDADNAQIVELHFNGVATKFTVPANDKVEVGPLAFWGMTDDGTELANKNISLKAANDGEITAMGRVID